MIYSYNFDNIKWGKGYKYFELCDELEIPRKTGNSKPAQIKDLKTVIELDDSKKGIYIPIKLYDIEKTQLSTGLLKGDIEVLLLDLLARNKGKHISLTIKYLMRALEMVNDNYIKGYSYEKLYLSLEELTKVDNYTIDDVYYLINNKGSKNIREALNDLQDKGLIIWEMKMMVCKYGQNHSFAEDKDKELILGIEKRVMKEMGVKNKRFFNINSEARGKFNTRRNQLLKDTDIEYYYYAYDITYHSEEILIELKRSDLASVRNRLNAKMISQMIKTIEGRKDKNETKLKEKFEDAYDIIDMYEDKISKLDKVLHDEDYEKNAKKVVVKLIDRNIRSRDKLK